MGPLRCHQGTIPGASAHRRLLQHQRQHLPRPWRGISLQECLTPVLVVSGGASSVPAAAITEISWKGLRCNLEVSGGTAGITADLRREAAGGPSVATTAKAVDDGGARLLVDDDELEGAAVVAVLLSPDGRVIAQRRTVVGGEA